MTEITPTLTTFVAQVAETQQFWGLADKSGEEWVVCDSAQFEETDALPVWSSEEEAKKHCAEEWEGYQPQVITLKEFMEFWVDDLNDDGVMVGINWILESDCEEIDPIELAKKLAEVETEE
ncbi:DUF2750 domain-containing protein [Shewanella sp. 202IG2-18]|uniref:DUF2750 domain-containing protein n=1 Tax=Parashewanella hymeniacidonis TaxID=2807618 RepID=UPI00195FB1DF|nr:DUF2750 domain-containing protein [Parashewanella hymeniacidonis]MBM7073699.1 DUF2750 domain-containing protein [Parashewanella hymeniacidonis]